MSTDSVLKALSVVTGVSLKTFALVKKSRIHGDKDDWYYLCFGRHALFIVDKDMNGSLKGGVLYSCPYSYLERCEADMNSNEFFAIFFVENIPLRPGSSSAPVVEENGAEKNVPCFPAMVVFQSPERDRLLSELETFFRTDYMFQHWQMPSDPFVVGVENEMSLGNDSSSSSRFIYTATNSEMKVEVLQGYVFQRGKTFGLEYYASRGGTFTARFEDKTQNLSMYQANAAGNSTTPMEDFLEIHFHEKHPVVQNSAVALTVAGEKDPSEVVEYYIRLVAEQVTDYRIIQPPQPHKKEGNLNGDLAEYSCWKAHIRTAGPSQNTKKSKELARRDVHIVVVQRKFIPPTMDSFQNIVLMCVNTYHHNRQSISFSEEIVSSLHYNSKTFAFDRLVVQTKADALMLDEESYSFYAKHLKIYPECVKLARKFCQCVLRILVRANLPFPPESMFPDVDLKKLGDDPYEYSLRMEQRIPGVSEQKSHPDLAREWKIRVWRYLAFCLDGGLLPGVLDISKIAQYVQQHDRRLAKLSQLLQTLLYFRRVGSEYEHVAFPLKVSDERLMQNFTFNERVMEKLLATGYIKNVLDATTDILEYPRFIVRLLQCGKDRTRWGYSLQYTVCKQLARSSSYVNSRSMENISSGLGKNQSNRSNGANANSKSAPLTDLALDTIVPALIDLLNDESTNEKIQVLVVSTLVNFTKNNTVIKNKVMAGGAIRKICQFLYSKHDDLVRHSCSLLNNCTKSEQYRGQVAKYKAIEALMRLLERNEFPPHYRSTRILIQACAVIGNLASDTRLRQRITEALGYEESYSEKFKGERYEQPKSIRVLVDLLQDRHADLTKQRDAKQRDALRVTGIFALKNLAIRHDENKRTIGRLAIEPLISILQTYPNEEHNRILLDVTLRCIYVLSFQRSVCKILQMYKVDKQLQALHGTFPDITRQIGLKITKT